MRLLPCLFALLAALPVSAEDDPAASSSAPSTSDAGAGTAPGGVAGSSSENAGRMPSGGAFQRVEERSPRTGTPLIANKLYPMQGKFEVGAMFDLSYADKYVEHLGGHGTLAYHVFDWLALEAFGGYLAGDETGIVDNVRRTDKGGGKSATNTPTCFDGSSGPCEPQLPGMYQTTWFAGAEAQWAPIYGKISAVSEYDLNFQLYGKFGGGAQGIHRYLKTGQFGETSVRPSGHYGLGLRLIPWKFVTVRAELTNYVGLNPNVEEHDKADESSCPDGFVLTQGNTPVCNPDLFQSSFFQVGLSFLL
jgi:outer membrane beta-barrel protein